LGYDREFVRKLIDELFDRYKKPYIYENEYRVFFGSKGYTPEEAWKIVFEAFKFGFIVIGIDVVSRDKYVVCIWRPEGVEE